MSYTKIFYPNHRRQRTLIALLMIGAAAAILSINLIGSGRAIQESKRVNISVQGPRPMARAIEVLETRCGCVITYEDPRYVHASDLSEVTAQVRKDLNKFKPGEAPRVFVPKNEELAIDYDESTNTKPPDGIAPVVQLLIEKHAARGNAGRFRMEMSNQVIHVIPSGIRNERGELAAQNSILDSVISLPATDRSGIQTLEAICAALTQTNGVRVIVGAVPLNIFFRYHDREGGISNKARDVLVNLLKGAGNDLSWQLFYDPGLKMYALNIHRVPTSESSN